MRYQISSTPPIRAESSRPCRLQVPRDRHGQPRQQEQGQVDATRQHEAAIGAVKALLLRGRADDDPLKEAVVIGRGRLRWIRSSPISGRAAYAVEPHLPILRSRSVMPLLWNLVAALVLEDNGHWTL
jgi:hypothetical protein